MNCDLIKLIRIDAEDRLKRKAERQAKREQAAICGGYYDIYKKAMMYLEQLKQHAKRD